ncbi:MAG: YicC/YloC family endoribonuclease [Planctomycetota bacterium]
MPRSMTGYGAARNGGGPLSVEAEARSVNGRSLKISVRAPPLLAPHEADLEGLVRRAVSRGSVTLSVRVERLEPGESVRLRPEVVEDVVRGLEPLRRRGRIEGALSADAVPHLPGALEPVRQDPLRPAEWREVKRTAQDALGSLNTMREREAVHLARELARILQRVRKNVAQVERRTPTVVRHLHRRMRERVEALLAETGVRVDDATLLREVALLADRADVTEEIARLRAHVEEFERYLGRSGGVGRTLDFLTQEMLREANTIGSKNVDIPTARAVVALKSEIERLKEQAANLE